MLIISAFSFFGCRQESLYAEHESQKDFISKNYVINDKEIKKDEKLWSKLSEIQTHVFGSNPTSKNNDPILGGAVIMTDYAGVIEKKREYDLYISGKKNISITGYRKPCSEKK